MRPINLDRVLLGPLIESQSAESFYCYVQSLKQDKPQKALKLRVKLPPMPHAMLDGRCTTCGKKPRKIDGKCSGPKKVKKELAPPETCDTTQT